MFGIEETAKVKFPQNQNKQFKINKGTAYAVQKLTINNMHIHHVAYLSGYVGCDHTALEKNVAI